MVVSKADRGLDHGGAPSLGWLGWMRGLMVLASGVSGYMAWVSMQGGAVAGCGPESGCHAVLNSRFAYAWGMPVSLLALPLYVAAFLFTWGIVPRVPIEKRAQAWWFLSFCGACFILAAMWFTYLQIFVVGQWCRFCMTSHVAGFLFGLSVFYLAPKGEVEAKSGGKGKRKAKGGDGAAVLSRGLALGLALLGCGVLVLGQFMGPRPAQVVESIEPMVADGAGEVAGDSSAEGWGVKRLLLHGGQVELRVDELPYRGDRAAGQVLLSLFDYTCHHCQEMHEHLKMALERYEGELGIVSLPMPLDSNCNRLMQRTPEAHVGACEYARLGLAVFRADREAFVRFDDWVFQRNPPPPLEETRAFAESLVTAEKLGDALKDPWVEERLAASISLYELHFQLKRKGQMPQVVAGNSIAFGPFHQAEGLFLFLETNLGLQRPSSGGNAR